MTLGRTVVAKPRLRRFSVPAEAMQHTIHSPWSHGARLAASGGPLSPSSEPGDKPSGIGTPGLGPPTAGHSESSGSSGWDWPKTVRARQDTQFDSGRSIAEVQVLAGSDDDTKRPGRRPPSHRTLTTRPIPPKWSRRLPASRERTTTATDCTRESPTPALPIMVDSHLSARTVQT